MLNHSGLSCYKYQEKSQRKGKAANRNKFSQS